MVANAGIGMFKPVFESASLPSVLFIAAIVTLVTAASVDDLNNVLAINVRGVMLCYKYAAMQMVKQGRGGRIIGMRSASVSIYERH